MMLYEQKREYIYAIPVSEETFEGRVVGDVSQKKQAAPPFSQNQDGGQSFEKPM